MKLTVKNRTGIKKSETKQIRREGNVPAVLYSSDRPNELVELNGIEIANIMRGIKPGRLSTTIFTLMFGNQERQAVIKDIQYNLTNYKITHIDLEELVKGTSVAVKVPILCTGMNESPGIKLGGFLRQVIRQVRVECPSDKIPAEFVVDVGQLGMRQTKRLSDLQMPSGVKPLADVNEVVVVIAKR